MKKILGLTACLFLLVGCATISQYSHYAYVQAVNLKVESLNMMDKGTEYFADHKQDSKILMLNIEKAYEYEKGRPKNDETAQMWEILKDPEKDLLGGFLKLWQKQEKLSEMYISEKKKQVEKAYDEIIGLESGKIKK